jgi:hypothetical protein
MEVRFDKQLAALFFFTTDGAYVEWMGDYMLCDKPLKLATPPVVTIIEKE